MCRSIALRIGEHADPPQHLPRLCHCQVSSQLSATRWAGDGFGQGPPLQRAEFEEPDSPKTKWCREPRAPWSPCSIVLKGEPWPNPSPPQRAGFKHPGIADANSLFCAWDPRNTYPMHCPNCLNIVLRFCSSCSVFVSNSFWLADLEMRKKPAASRPDVESLRMRPAASLPEHVALEDCPPSEPKRRTKKKSSSDEHPRKRPAEFRPGVEPPRKRPAASLPDNVAGEASPFYGTLVAECIAVNTQRLGAPAEKELMEKLLRDNFRRLLWQRYGRGRILLHGPLRS